VTVADLTSHRAAHWRLDLLTSDGAPMGVLDGSEGGGLEWTANASVKGAGALTVADIGGAIRDTEGNVVDLLNVRIRPVYVLDAVTEWPRSVFIPSMARARWSDEGRVRALDLHDKSIVLAQDRIDAPFTVDAGDNVIEIVREIILGAGEEPGALTDSDETVTNARTFKTGTSKLTIVNTLLDSAAYLALYVSMAGQFVAEPYVTPSARPLAWTFSGEEAVYTPDFEDAEDIYEVPNKVIRQTAGSGDAEGLIAVATNTNPDSPYSYARRGNRWIVNEDAAEPVEATSQEALDIIAQRDLVSASGFTASRDINHAPLPDITVNAATQLIHEPSGINARHVVTKTSLVIEAEGAMELATSTLRQVVSTS
jgi:hypothetical protein